MASACNAATPAKRNQIARERFSAAVVTQKTAVAVVPRPDVAPFFETHPRLAVNQGGEECTGGSDGLRSRARTTDPAVVVVGLPPERRVVGRSGRAPYQRRSMGRLTGAEREAVRRLADNRTLREVAAEVGVSHETVRSILRRADRPAPRDIVARPAA